VEDIGRGHNHNIKAMLEKLIIVGIGRTAQLCSSALGSGRHDVTHGHDLPSVQCRQVAGMAESTAVAYVVAAGAN
jgi:hypothetical protein